jgi:hypothetical protein
VLHSDLGPAGRLSLTEASVEWGRGGFSVLQLNGNAASVIVQLSCLSVASCLSSTTERFLLGDCPITTGNRSSLSLTALSGSLHQPGCQILQSRWRNFIAFSKIRYSWGRFLKTVQSVTQIKSSPSRKNGFLNIKIFRAMSCIPMKVYWRRRGIFSVRFQRSLLHQLMWRHFKIVVVCPYRCECIKSRRNLFML